MHHLDICKFSNLSRNSRESNLVSFRLRASPGCAETRKRSQGLARPAPAEVDEERYAAVACLVSRLGRVGHVVSALLHGGTPDNGATVNSRGADRKVTKCQLA